MVRRADEVCVEDLFPSSCAAAIRFDGHNCPFLLAETRTFSRFVGRPHPKTVSTR